MNEDIRHYRTIHPNIDVYPIGSVGYVAYDAAGRCIGAISVRTESREPYAVHVNGRTFGIAHGITEAIGYLVRLSA